MSRTVIYLLISFSLLLSGQSSSSAPLTQSAKILWVPMEGTVELGLSPYIKRSLDYASENGFDAVVLDIDTFGGRVDAAVTIRDALLDSPLQTVAWVNKRAISAGALISLACKKIFYTPGSTMGAATPIQVGGDGEAKSVDNKIVSYFRAEMGSTAERNGRNRKLAEAMVLATDDIPGLVKKGDVLTLTDKTALENKMSDGTIATKEELIRKLGFDNPTIEIFEINWAEQIVRFVTEPTVSGLLMSAGILGLFLEFQSPGFGLPGIVGISCLALFFFGKWIVHLAEWQEVILLLLGIILIMIEIFLLPGKIIAGAAGALLVFLALFLAGVSPKIPFDFSMPDVRSHMNTVSISFLLAFAGMILAYFFVARNPKKSPLVMGDSLTRAEGYTSSDPHSELVGLKGILTTDLRPTGKAEIQSKIYEVHSQGDWLKKGSPVKVIGVEGLKIIVDVIR